MIGAMTNLIVFNKPFNVLSQFTGDKNQTTLANYLNDPSLKGFYPAGRLDYDSEGLLLLTNDGQLQHRIAHPEKKMPKTYWVQVEGSVTEEQIRTLQGGVALKDGLTKTAKVKEIAPPNLWPRDPPVRKRDQIPTSWIELIISEGKNRQVRRMTAAVGLPTLRLIRTQIGPWTLSGLQPGQHTKLTVNLPQNKPARKRFAKSRP